VKLNTILVPLDGSALAEAALPRALEAVRESGARLLLLRAAEAHRLPGLDPTQAQIRVTSDAEDYLARIAERLRHAGLPGVETSVWYGPAPWAIVEAARVRHADLIVMTTHGRSGLGRLILGSVAESVVRGTRTPILLLRADDAPVDAPIGVTVSGANLQPGPVPPRSARHPEGVA
jgi:nucleotide-binding universal stress UspA family protein